VIINLHSIEIKLIELTVASAENAEIGQLQFRWSFDIFDVNQKCATLKNSLYDLTFCNSLGRTKFSFDKVQLYSRSDCVGFDCCVFGFSG